MPLDSYGSKMRHFGFPVGGVLLLAVGAWWLLGELGVVNFSWGIVAPVALILLGAGIIVRRLLWRRWAARHGYAAGCCGWEPRSEGAP